MGARVMVGRGLAAELEEELAAQGGRAKGRRGLARSRAVLVGSPAEAAVYERRVRSLEMANTGDIVRTDTISVGSARGKGSSDD